MNPYMHHKMHQCIANCPNHHKILERYNKQMISSKELPMWQLHDLTENISYCLSTQNKIINSLFDYGTPSYCMSREPCELTDTMIWETCSLEFFFFWTAQSKQIVTQSLRPCIKCCHTLVMEALNQLKLYIPSYCLTRESSKIRAFVHSAIDVNKIFIVSLIKLPQCN